jgi:hypothetical protein
MQGDRCRSFIQPANAPGVDPTHHSGLIILNSSPASAPDVDVQHPIHIPETDGLNGAQEENAGIHLDDVEPPEHFDRLRDGTLYRDVFIEAGVGGSTR